MGFSTWLTSLLRSLSLPVFGPLEQPQYPQQRFLPAQNMQKALFKLTRYATFADVPTLKVGEALLLHKRLVLKTYKNHGSAQAAVRCTANKSEMQVWMTTTKVGHLLVYRKPTTTTPLA